jgi:hypothetical protein
MAKFATGMFGTSVVLMLLGKPALACDAPPGYPNTPESRWLEFDVIARGTVKSFSSRTRWLDGHWDTSEGSWMTKLLDDLGAETDSRVVIAVDEAWRGVEFDAIVVHDDGPDTCCGMRHFEVGDEVLVYAKADEGKLWVNGYCAPIMPIADAQADLDYLGPGQREFRSLALRRASYGALVAIPLLLLGGLLLRRRYSRHSIGMRIG